MIFLKAKKLPPTTSKKLFGALLYRIKFSLFFAVLLLKTREYNLFLTRLLIIFRHQLMYRPLRELIQKPEMKFSDTPKTRSRSQRLLSSSKRIRLSGCSRSSAYTQEPWKPVHIYTTLRPATKSGLDALFAFRPINARK